jgi:hypothetical protein
MIPGKNAPVPQINFASRCPLRDVDCAIGSCEHFARFLQKSLASFY